MLNRTNACIFIPSTIPIFPRFIPIPGPQGPPGTNIDNVVVTTNNQLLSGFTYGTRFLSLTGSQNRSIETDVIQVFPTAGTVNSMTVSYNDLTQDLGGNLTITLRINGSSTTNNVVINDANKTETNSTPVGFVAGDSLNYQIDGMAVLPPTNFWITISLEIIFS